MDRRDVLLVLGSAAVAAPAKVDIAAYKPRFFTAAEYDLLDALTDTMLPNDGTPGAREAGVRYYIDTMLHHGAATLQTVWREGLREVDAAARLLHGKSFVAATAVERAAVMDRFAAAEGRTPANALESFFLPFKLLTVEAYALSETAQRDYFGYRGNGHLDQFPGCQDDCCKETA